MQSQRMEVDKDEDAIIPKGAGLQIEPVLPGMVPMLIGPEYPTRDASGELYSPELFTLCPENAHIQCKPPPAEGSSWWRMRKFHPRVSEHGMHAVASVIKNMIRPQVYDGANVTLILRSPLILVLGPESCGPVPMLTNSHDQLSDLLVMKQCFLGERMREVQRKQAAGTLTRRDMADLTFRVQRANQASLWERARTLTWMNGEMSALAADPEAQSINAHGAVCHGDTTQVSPLLGKWATISHQYAVRRCWEVERFIIVFLGLDWRVPGVGGFGAAAAAAAAADAPAPAPEPSKFRKPAPSATLGGSLEENAHMLGLLFTPTKNRADCAQIASKLPPTILGPLRDKLEEQQYLRTAELVAHCEKVGWHIQRPFTQEGGVGQVRKDDWNTLTLKGLRFQMFQYADHVRK